MANELIQRAGALVYQKHAGEFYYLLISTVQDSDLFILPQGHNDAGETLEETAVRETREEAAVEIAIEKRLGSFCHQARGHFFQTEIFLAVCRAEGAMQEQRTRRWCRATEVEGMNVPGETRQFIREAERELKSSGE